MTTIDDYVLYTVPCSLYSGKARAYLRGHRIEHQERFVGIPATRA